ncbi:unnamed protein product [Nezara viridula]|uniref:Vitellogenin n=1 Tax=Nezara viridula TaxID=85310 RepID=A0A9P0HH53_NEZVI|nr:unnamed protein product [Nezara viridula]
MWKMFWLNLGLFLLCVSVSISAEISLFPEGREISYKWYANVSSGTILPSNLQATWSFQAILKVQQQSTNFTAFQITEVLLNPDEDYSWNISSLTLPFGAVYINGELNSLIVHEDDETWSVNMKRALTSTLQIKLEFIVADVLSIITEESNHYGRCVVEYEKFNLPSKKYKIRKSVDHESCKDYPAEHFSNAEMSLCPGTYQGITASDSERIFIVSPFEECLIQEVNATGRILVQPYQSNAESHYSKIGQTFKMLDIRTLNSNQTLNIESDGVAVDLVYETFKIDPTYGKNSENRTEIVNKIFLQLGELSDSLQTWEVGVKGLDNETSFRILDLMWWLEMNDWEKLYEATLGTSYRQETIQNLFWDLVPNVGSRSAVLFIKKVVKNGQVKGFLAGRLLASIPFYIRETSDELLTACEDLLTLGGDIPTEVKQQAILTFASLLYKTCKTKCKTDTLDRYSKLYLDKITESSNYENQMLYLQGLSNIHLGQVLDFLEPLISGQVPANKHIRFLAVWATLHTVYFNPNKVYEVYWPLFTNKSESLELRVASLTLLIMSKPSISRFFSIYLHMQAEPSEQLYNFYYTTIQSLARTNYPCYAKIGQAAAKFARFVPAKSRHWATGNYLLDFEDPDRAYGGFLQTLLIASEVTGLPNVYMFMVEQHSLGHTRLYALYLKTSGLNAAINDELKKIATMGNANLKISKVVELLGKLKVPVLDPEKLHLELILKIDDKTVLIYYFNEASFKNWTQMVRHVSSLYIEFSLNYQSLAFPSVISYSEPTDLGIPSLIKMRSASLISTRGSINQENEGKARNAELDLRYSWNGVTTHRVYNPLNNKWYGADRCRNIHIRLPFATKVILQVEKSVYKVKAVRHRDFVTGSKLGLVWHASTRLVSKTPVVKQYPNIRDEWTMDSEDLGARLGASVFDCSNPDTLPDALHLLKKAFMANHKNYNMVPGGVVLLGILALKDQLQFQPQGISCGVMLYFTPLLTQVKPELYIEGYDQMKISMTRKDGPLWEIQAGSKRLQDGNKEFTFKLYRAPSVSVTVAHIWRVIQFEGAFIVPSRMSGVSDTPAALTGYTFVSWGDASPSLADKAAVLDLKLLPSHNDSGGLYCKSFTPGCLQAASDLAARQIATIEYANLPSWLKMAAHALFPEQFQTESSQTQITFSYPMALLPWNTKGLCAVNSGSVLTLDNATIPSILTDCYTLAVADCSKEAQFSIQVKKLNNMMGIKIYCGNDSVELFPNSDIQSLVHVNGNKVENIKQGYHHTEMNEQQLSVRMTSEGIVEVELTSGVMLQLYNTTAVILIPAQFRGLTCGLCGDFNGDIINEPSMAYNDCENQ